MSGAFMICGPPMVDSTKISVRKCRTRGILAMAVKDPQNLALDQLEEEKEKTKAVFWMCSRHVE